MVLTEVANFLYGNGVPMIVSPLVIDGHGFAVERAQEAEPFGIFSVHDTEAVFKNLAIKKGDYDPSLGNKVGNALFIENSLVIVKNVDFMNNYSYYGGAIFVDDSRVSIQDSSFVKNSATTDGGAIALLFNSRITVSNTDFVDNSSVSNGGAIYSLTDSTSLLVVDSTFSGNKSIDGSGGAIDSGFNNHTKIINSHFTNNSANNVGGAILSNSEKMIVKNSSFVANSAENSGGAIQNNNGLIISESIFRNNNSSDGGAIDNWGHVSIVNSGFLANKSEFGGAIWNRHSWNGKKGEILVDSSYFYLNSAQKSGGAIFNLSDISLLNTSLAHNSAGNSGGGILSDDNANVEISYVTIANNEAKDGNGIFVDSNIFVNPNEASPVGPAVHISNSIIFDDCSVTNDFSYYNSVNNLGTGFCAEVELTGLDSVFQDNGGDTLTYALLADSNAIDAADESISACPAFDQRGEARDDGQCDIGAYEYKAKGKSNSDYSLGNMSIQWQ